MRTLALLVLVGSCYRGEPAPTAPPRVKPAPQPRHARTAVDPLGFLPIDSQLVAHLDVVKLRQSSAWPRFEPTILAKTGTVVGQFQALCGFDPLPMIQSIAIGIHGVDTPQLGGVFVVRGLARGALMPCIEKAITQQPTVGSIDRGIVTIRGDANEPPVVFAYADTRTVVLLAGHGSSADALRHLLDAGAPPRGSQAFMDMFGRIDPRRAAWFFLDGNSKMFAQTALMGFKPRGVVGFVDLQSGLTAKIIARMATATEAQTLVATFQSQLTAAQSLVAKLELIAEDADIVVDLALTDDQLVWMSALLAP